MAKEYDAVNGMFGLVDAVARKMHEWYMEATAHLHPESFNPKAQKTYDELTDEQKYIDRYIAVKVLEELMQSFIRCGGAVDDSDG